MGRPDEPRCGTPDQRMRGSQSSGIPTVLALDPVFPADFLIDAGSGELQIHGLTPASGIVDHPINHIHSFPD
jgi:hypothetical protein